MKRFAFLFLILFASIGYSQQLPAPTAYRIIYGPSLPSTCNPATGDVFVVNANTSARGLYLCGSQNTWEMANGTGYFDVRLFGAKGDGVTDDRASIQAAYTAASTAGGGTVFIPEGTYRLASRTAAPHILVPPNNVSTLGAGYNSVLFVANGMNGPTNGVNDDFNVLYSVALSNATFRNFRINFNGANNLIPVTDTGKSNYGIGCTTCTNVTIEGVWFENDPGSRMISLTGITGVSVRGNWLHNIGTAVPGNALSPDYSMISTDAGTRAVIANNILWNDTFAGEGTAIEVWTDQADVTGNVGLNQGKAFNIVATTADQTGSVFANNTFRGQNTAIQVYTDAGFTLRNVTVANNIFVQANNPAALSLPQVNLYNTVATLLDSMLITGNTFRSTLAPAATIGSGIDIGSVGKLTISNNTFDGILGRAISLVTITTATLELAVTNNVIRDCGRTTNAGYQGGVILNQVAGTVVKSCKIIGNTIQNTGAPGMTTAIGGNADMTDLYIEGNHIIGIATRISMTGTLTLRQILDTGSLSISTFAALGAPANGQFRYCSDCTIANPCAGGGTGALAKRLNGAWVCN